MSWLLLVIGLAIASLGSAGAAALVTTARVALAEAISRRLRGTRESLSWLATTERQVVAATAATSLGVALFGAAIPGLLTSATPLELALFVCVVAVPLTLVAGYLLPRWLTATRAEAVVEQLRRVLGAWTAMLGVVLPSRAADPNDDVRALAREGTASGLGGDELVMVGGVMTFGTRPVREVMTPRTEVVAVPHTASASDVETIFAESGYTRLPVYGATLDEIVGMIHAFDLFKYQEGEALPLRPLSFAPERRPAGDVLIDMQRERQHFAVVVDEFGGTAGIVTLEDLLEALVGEIADEDATSPVQALPTGDFLELDGAAPPSLVAEHFGISLPPSAAASFGGLIGELAGRIPRAGERFWLGELEVDVLQASQTRIERVVIRRTRAAPIVLRRQGQ